MSDPQVWGDELEPASAEVVAALTAPGAFELFMRLLERPAPIARERGADALVAAGLIEPWRAQAGVTLYRPAATHMRDGNAQPAASLALRQAVLRVAESVLREAKRNVEKRGPDARAGLGLVTLPDEPVVLARAAEILARAEDELRTLGAPPEPGAPAIRVTMLVTNR